MYNTSIVLDACTIINLLRIDDENGFLLDLLLTQYTSSDSLFITEEVLLEVQRNIFANEITDEQKQQINKELPRLQLYQKKNSDITSFQEVEGFVREYSNYKNKRFNGELCSSLFCVIHHGFESNEPISFITDDYPAKEQFSELFSFLQIGIIEDTIDLLISLYKSQSSSVFTKPMLIEYISRLRSRYAQDAERLVETAKRVKGSFNTVPLQRKHRDAISALNQIIEGWYKMDWKTFFRGIDAYKNCPNKSLILNPLTKNSNIISVNEHLEKIKKRMNDIEKYDGFLFKHPKHDICQS